MRIRNSATPNSELIVQQRPNGGVKIIQGPVYILVGPGEKNRLIQALEESL